MSTQSESTTVGLDLPRVRRWLAEHVPALEGEIDFEFLSGGRSNLTYRITDAAGHAYALRRPPVGGVLSTAHDVGREWAFISALAPTGFPVAEPVALCDDTEVTGAAFYVMGFVDGKVLADEEAGLEFPEGSRAPAADHLVDVLVQLHSFDPVEVGLGDLVRRTGFVERQLRRWQAQVHASGAADLALLDEVHDLLAEHVPAQSTGIVHGDYRPGNLAFAPDGRVTGVFDWELATSGDPMADLGWLISTWAQADDDVLPTTPGPSAVPGFPGRDAVVERYARLSGRDVSGLPYWLAFSRWRSACISAGVRARYTAGHMADDGYREQLTARSESESRMAHAARESLRDLGI
ncbi:phosphotransferase family protein [Nocardioides insulae]|uniref:phosphotransferase family protein n=1 Tax=Nocardioides insulae TaxID=394734 RepID=UPI000416D0DD|nr:phosphotransferase family protein [Nocardioides insulae]